ncbi:MAG TPA: nucleoside monophosphate kinase [Candidatus Sulfobium mesophilum]|nr:nucleoside monophosphate kinase [Candidatus Sulfobium mesophilum]
MSPVGAILLIGPTGVGKTPFGSCLEKNGFRGRRCLHFDFGQELRSVAGKELPPEGFNRREQAFIRDVLEKGLLLENEHFPIAEKVVDSFLRRKGFGRGDILVLNGLPRHEDQAKDIDRKMEVRGLIVLDCEAEDIFERIRHNTGGDRMGRSDDGVEMIRKKLAIFHTRTAPLISHYAKAGRGVFRLKVSSFSTAEGLYSDFLSFEHTALF